MLNDNLGNPTPSRAGSAEVKSFERRNNREDEGLVRVVVDPAGLLSLGTTAERRRSAEFVESSRSEHARDDHPAGTPDKHAFFGPSTTPR